MFKRHTALLLLPLALSGAFLLTSCSGTVIDLPVSLPSADSSATTNLVDQPVDVHTKQYHVLVNVSTQYTSKDDKVHFAAKKNTLIAKNADGEVVYREEIQNLPAVTAMLTRWLSEKTSFESEQALLKDLREANQK
jgi:biopolymer transport protein ExbD